MSAGVRRGEGGNGHYEIQSRAISPTVQAMLWGRAAARCEFEDCNRPVSMSDVTFENSNMAEKAHIRAFSRGGPRATPEYPLKKLNDVENLMLLCLGCHQRIDQAGAEERYTVAVLERMKHRHEDRIDMVTGVLPRQRSHVVTYGASVGQHVTVPTFAEAQAALFPERSPAQRQVISLGTKGGVQQDRDATFWETEREQLCKQFDRRVRSQLEDGSINHLSVFALAPQPLLIQLGVLLGDITEVDVYQRHREPPGWEWPRDGVAQPFEVRRPEQATGTPTLVFSLSANIAEERVTAVVEDAAIWRVTVPEPGNDIVKSRAALASFRRLMRQLIAEIQDLHGIGTMIHIFPCMAASLAVELGRVRMPKVDAPWMLYDQVAALGGFVPAFSILPEA
jgi:hypothetical protein